MNNYTLWLISYDDAVYKQSTVTLCVPDVNVTNANCWKNGINNLEIHFFLIFEYPPSLTFCFFLSYHVWELLAKTSVISEATQGFANFMFWKPETIWSHFASFCPFYPEMCLRLQSKHHVQVRISDPASVLDHQFEFQNTFLGGERL